MRIGIPHSLKGSLLLAFSNFSSKTDSLTKVTCFRDPKTCKNICHITKVELAPPSKNQMSPQARKRTVAAKSYARKQVPCSSFPHIWTKKELQNISQWVQIPWSQAVARRKVIVPPRKFYNHKPERTFSSHWECVRTCFTWPAFCCLQGT